MEEITNNFGTYSPPTSEQSDPAPFTNDINLIVAVPKKHQDKWATLHSTMNLQQEAKLMAKQRDKENEEFVNAKFDHAFATLQVSSESNPFKSTAHIYRGSSSGPRKNLRLRKHLAAVIVWKNWILFELVAGASSTTIRPSRQSAYLQLRTLHLPIKREQLWMQSKLFV